jgi:spore germination protein KA
MTRISTSLKKNVQWLENRFKDYPAQQVRLVMDFITRGRTKVPACWLWIDGMVDAQTLQQEILHPLGQYPVSPSEPLWLAVQHRIGVKSGTHVEQLETVFHHVFEGHVLLLLQKETIALSIPLLNSPKRSITEPPGETSIRGSHEGFVESLETNIALIRKRILSPNLQIESYLLGEAMPITLKVLYLSDLVNPDMRTTLREKIRGVARQQTILSSGELEQRLEDTPYSIFPTTGNTEKPDKAAAQLLEGRLVLLLNGDPTALYYPHFFIESIMNTEDYASRPYYVSFIRILRAASLFVSILLPAYYIAMLEFHKEMIPTALLPKLHEASAKSPFPIVLEVLVMVFMFEIVREAGIRLPKSVGSAVSIVGALILGEVSVDAGIVSAPTIIVVALSAITGFTLTPVADVIALLRIANIGIASLLGLYGVILLTLGVLCHMISLTSMSEPFMAPFAPLYPSDLRDGLIRSPHQVLRKQPHFLKRWKFRDERNP